MITMGVSQINHFKPQVENRMSETKTEAWTNHRLLQWTTEFFTKKELDSPRLAAEVLLAAALNCNRIDIYARFNEIPVEPELGIFRDWVKRHGAGEPVAYLVGHQEFYSLKFNVDSSVLIPRPETEHVIMEAVEAAKSFGDNLRVADVGTGSGCIAITLAKQLAHATCIASDLSELALKVAQSNIELQNVEAKVELLESDLLASYPDDSQFELIVSNPPYIGRNEQGTVDENVAKYEPETALYGGPEGTELIERLVDQAADRLVDGGYLIFEMSPIISQRCREIVEGSSLEFVKIEKDYSGHDRVVVAKKPSL